MWGKLLVGIVLLALVLVAADRIRPLGQLVALLVYGALGVLGLVVLLAAVLFLGAALTDASRKDRWHRFN